MASGTIERLRLLLRRMGRTMSFRPGWMSMAAAYLAEQICAPSRDDAFLHVRGYNGEAAAFCLERYWMLWNMVKAQASNVCDVDYSLGLSRSMSRASMAKLAKNALSLGRLPDWPVVALVNDKSAMALVIWRFLHPPNAIGRNYLEIYSQSGNWIFSFAETIRKCTASSRSLKHLPDLRTTSITLPLAVYDGNFRGLI